MNTSLDFIIASFSDEDGFSVSDLKKLKHLALSKAANAKGFTHKAATEFTIEDSVQDFGLKYSNHLDEYEQKHYWNIKRDIKAFKPSSCFSKVSS